MKKTSDAPDHIWEDDMSYATFHINPDKRVGKTSGGAHLVDGEWITTAEVAKRANCSIFKTRKYIVNGVMKAQDFISLQTKSAPVA